MAEKKDELGIWGLRVDPGGATLPGGMSPRESVVIGRGVDCDIMVKDAKASRQHCRLTRRDGDFLLEDLQSRNGTYVEGRKIDAPTVLKLNQSFQVGDTVFYLSR